MRRGAAWGLGHSATLVLIASAYWWADFSISPQLESALGIVTLGIGLWVLYGSFA